VSSVAAGSPQLRSLATTTARGLDATERNT
jgi:hypothetical protein